MYGSGPRRPRAVSAFVHASRVPAQFDHAHLRMVRIPAFLALQCTKVQTKSRLVSSSARGPPPGRLKPLSKIACAHIQIARLRAQTPAFDSCRIMLNAVRLLYSCCRHYRPSIGILRLDSLTA
jgi:hypothetical protein